MPVNLKLVNTPPSCDDVLDVINNACKLMELDKALEIAGKATYEEKKESGRFYLITTLISGIASLIFIYKGQTSPGPLAFRVGAGLAGLVAIYTGFKFGISQKTQRVPTKKYQKILSTLSDGAACLNAATHVKSTALCLLVDKEVKKSSVVSKSSEISEDHVDALSKDYNDFSEEIDFQDPALPQQAAWQLIHSKLDVTPVVRLNEGRVNATVQDWDPKLKEVVLEFYASAQKFQYGRVLQPSESEIHYVDVSVNKDGKIESVKPWGAVKV